LPIPLADVAEEEPINILYTGPGGTAKTTNIMRAATFGRVWVANAESGVKARALRQRGIPIENIEIFPGPGEELTYESLEGEWMRIRETLHKDPTAYYAVAWDSITEIQQQMKDKEVARAALKAANRGQARDPFVVDQDNWRTINEQCRSLIRKFRDLDCHFLASSLQRREQDPNGKVVYKPAVTPGLQDDLIGWMDIICVTSTIIVNGEEEFMGLFRNDGMYQAKDRFSVTPRKLVLPTFDRVLEYFNGEHDLMDPLATDEEMQGLKARMLNEADTAPKVPMDALA
jgi:hypothetical protein